MSAKALFIPTTDDGAGSYWAPVTERIAELPRDEQAAADRVWKAIVDFLPEGRAEFTITDRMLRQSRWLCDFSLRFVQKGLHALQRIGLIDRLRRRGRRTIIVIDRLRGRPEKAPAAPASTTRPATTKAAMIPNVGIIQPPTPEELAVHNENLARAEVLEMTEEERREAEATLEKIRRRRGIGRPPDP